MRSVFDANKVRSFAHNDIVHPAVGVTLRKDTTIRSSISDSILSLQTMWEDALCMQHGGDARVTFDPCFVCDTFDDGCTRCACVKQAHTNNACWPWRRSLLGSLPLCIRLNLKFLECSVCRAAGVTPCAFYVRRCDCAGEHRRNLN